MFACNLGRPREEGNDSKVSINEERSFSLKSDGIG